MTAALTLQGACHALGATQAACRPPTLKAARQPPRGGGETGSERASHCPGAALQPASSPPSRSCHPPRPPPQAKQPFWAPSSVPVAGPESCVLGSAEACRALSLRPESCCGWMLALGISTAARWVCSQDLGGLEAEREVHRGGRHLGTRALAQDVTVGTNDGKA